MCITCDQELYKNVTENREDTKPTLKIGESVDYWLSHTFTYFHCSCGLDVPYHLSYLDYHRNIDKNADVFQCVCGKIYKLTIKLELVSVLLECPTKAQDGLG